MDLYAWIVACDFLIERDQLVFRQRNVTEMCAYQWIP